MNYEKQFRQIWRSIKSWVRFRERRENRIRKHLNEIRRGECEIRRDYDWIPLYFRYRQSDIPAQLTVDDRTWDDLEMDQVFARVDRTVSVIGRQYLYAMLRTYKSDLSGQEKQRLNALYSVFRTDDIELQPLLANCARMFHFSEQVDGDRYYFDFILRDGPCHEGNAIRLIELKGYPPDLVTEARSLADNQRSPKGGITYASISSVF